MEHQPVIYVITGPVAAGKSTVARLLASRLERGVHLEGDMFRRSIVGGRVPIEQLRLRYRLAAAVADGYFEAGSSVALDDVLSGSMLGDYRMMIRSRPCHIVVLVPSLEAVAARTAGRDHTGYGAWTVEQLYEDFVSQTPRIGLWLDTTHLTPDETAAEILARTTSTRSPIIVTAYDDGWPRIYEELAEPIRETFADLGARVKHVGSTSVPGLAAKPVIDMDVIVRSADVVDAAIERLRSLGYVYQGDKGIPGREAFMWPLGAAEHHLYVVVQGSRPHLDHIEFRNYLREHPEVANGYAAVKFTLAAEYGDDRLGYTDAKTEFVTGVMRDARSCTTRPHP